MNPSLVLCRLPGGFILLRVTNRWLLFEGGYGQSTDFGVGSPCVFVKSLTVREPEWKEGQTMANSAHTALF